MDSKNKAGTYIGTLWHRLNLRFAERLAESDIDLTPDQYRLMTYLWDEEGVSQQRLADAMTRDRAALTRMIDILEKKDFAKRVPSKIDRRVKNIYLTKKGKDLESMARNPAKVTLADMQEGFTAEERELCEKLLLRMIKNLY